MATLNFYKDLSLDFTPHPVSGDVRPIVDDLAIRRSIINLISTPKGKKPFYPEYGCTISSYLFSNPDVFTKSSMADSVYEALTSYESRIDIIEIEPTQLSGATIKNITGINAKYIQSNNIGTDSIIEIVRSGEVIPKVLKVIKPTFNITIDFPKNYVWHVNNIHIMPHNNNTEDRNIKLLTFIDCNFFCDFFKNLVII